MAKHTPLMTHKERRELSLHVNNLPEMFSALKRLADEGRNTWSKWADRLTNFIENDFQGQPPFSVFARKGNIKLPFVSFSALPFVTCPGMGACAEYCYSIKSWRNSPPFYRQLQNTLLIKYAPHRVVEAAEKLLSTRKFRKMEFVDLRLYVDGDFGDMETLEFWMRDFLPRFPKFRAYGYSKSFELFLNYAEKHGSFPSNYIVNQSNGSIYDNTPIAEAFSELDVVRGEFRAVILDSDKKFRATQGDLQTKEYRQTVRKSHPEKHFPCPGYCGTCTGNGHACAIKTLDIPIVIGIHK